MLAYTINYLQYLLSSQPFKPLKHNLLRISVLIHLVCEFLFAAQVVSWYKSSMLWLPSLRELPVWASKLATASSLPQKRNTNPFFMRNTQHTKWKRLQTPSEWFTRVTFQKKSTFCSNSCLKIQVHFSSFFGRKLESCATF